jgi:uncharacterized membrane protein YfcA
MEPVLIILGVLLITGCIAGFASGLLGVGGAFIMVPVQYWLLTSTLSLDDTVAIRVAFATSLAVALPTALSAMIGHMRKGSVLWEAAIWMGVAGIAGGMSGGYIATHVEGGILRVLFAVLMALIAVRMALPTSIGTQRAMVNNRIIFAITGFIVGTFTGMLGIGGGVVMVPVCILLLGLSPYLAIGTSSAYIVCATSGALIPYIAFGTAIQDFPFPALGYIDLFQWLILIVTTVPMAQLGVSAAYRIPDTYFRYIFTALLLYIALRMSGIA